MNVRLILLCALIVIPLAADDTKDRVVRAIHDLGADDFAIREEASRVLWLHGKTAEPSLREAARSGNPEARVRAAAILAQFDAGFSPEPYGLTPRSAPVLLDLLRRHRMSEGADRRAALEEILLLDPPDGRLLAAIWRADAREDARGEFVDLVSRWLKDIVPHQLERLSAIVPHLIENGDLDLAEDLLRKAAKANPVDAGRQYAAFLTLLGRLDGAIARGKSELESNPSPDASAVMALLCRAQGNLPEAFRYADFPEYSRLAESILVEMGNWEELSRRAPVGVSELAALSRRAAYQRLAGRDRDAAETLVAIRQNGGNSDASSAWKTARALLLNERPDEALRCIEQAGDIRRVFVYLSQHLRMDEALSRWEQVQVKDARETFELDRMAIWTLLDLGENDRAIKCAERWIREGDPDQRMKVLGTLFSNGLLKESMFAEVLKGLHSGESNLAFRSLISSCFPRHYRVAPTVWAHVCRLDSKKPVFARLQRVRDILAGKAEDDLYEKLVDEAKGVGTVPEDRFATFQGLAELCVETGRIAVARRCLERYLDLQQPDPATRIIGDPESAYRALGDLEAKAERWPEAASRYLQAWEHDRVPASLYFHGRALQRIGKESVGAEAIKNARLYPLAKDEFRHYLARAMKSCGAEEDAAREWEFILKTGALNGAYTLDALEATAQRAEDLGEFPRAVHLRERALIVIHTANTSSNYFTSYFSTLSDLHRCRARGRLGAGDVAGAVREAKYALALDPADNDTPIALVPELDRRGFRSEADEVYSVLRDRLDAICRAHPAAAKYCNQFAWLAAKCGRELALALERAENAVRLKPASATYLDTLAEVHFRRGDRDQAVAKIQECIRLDPDNPYYRVQLQRFVGK